MKRLPAGRARARLVIALSAIALSAVLLSATQYSAATSQPPTPSVEHALSEHFALLREPANTTPPASVLAAIDHAPAKLGLNASGARYTSQNAAWLIPGAAWLCIAAQDSEGLGIACATSTSAIAGQLAFVDRSTTDSSSRIVGAAPDGDTQAVGQRADGSTAASAAVSQNTFRLSGSQIERTTLSSG
jgi:hypothetical protein